jgi:hypothetical protein
MTIANSGNIGINKNNPATALDVNGTITATRFRWAASAEISPDQGGSIELGDSLGTGTVPFIDFHYGVGFDQDHNVRLINNADGQLSVEGAFHTTGPVTAPSFSGNGAGLANVNADTLGGLSGSTFWKTTGNAGTTAGTHFLGTTDNQALVMKVANTVALQISPGVTVPNIVGGLAGIQPSVIASGVSGAVIAGGNAPSGV